MKGKFTLILMTLCLCDLAYGSCPTRKVSRRKQLSRLRTIQENDVVVEATYWGKQASLHTFLIETTWAKQNGSLHRNNFISVDAAGSAVEACFEELGGKKSYILMLTPQQQSSTIFGAIEPPVQSDRKRDQKHRQSVWEKVCAKLEGQSACQTRVTVPSSEDIYRGRLHIMECKVESNTEVVSVEWDKDGKTLGSSIHEKAGISVSNDDTSANIIIQHANHIHNGKYGCTATSADGQIAKGFTHLQVVGPEENTKIQCSITNYCLNQGTCHEDENGSNRYCICPSGFEGPRCERISIEAVREDKNLENMENKVSGLTVALVVLAVGFVGFIIFASIYVFQLRTKLSQKKTQYMAVQQNSATFNHTVEDARTTSSPIGGIGVDLNRLSVTKAPQVSHSRRSSATPIKYNSLQRTAETNQLEQPTPRGSTSGSPRDFDLNPQLAGSMSRHSSLGSGRERLNAKS